MTELSSTSTSAYQALSNRVNLDDPVTLQILEVLPVGVVVLTRESKELYYNSIARKIWFGVCPVSCLDISQFRATTSAGIPLQKNDWPYHQAFQEKIPVSGKVIHIEFEDGIHKTVLASASPVPVEYSGNLVQAVFAVFQELTHTGMSELSLPKRSRHAHFLSSISKVLSESLDYDVTLAKVAHLAVPAIADWCIMDVAVDGNGKNENWKRVAVEHCDPEKAELAAELKRDFAPLEGAKGVPSQVLRLREPLLIPQVTESHYAATARSPRHLQILKALGSGSYMCVPMMAHGKLVGALTLVVEKVGGYNEADLAFALELSSRAALAMENARLYSDARRAIRLREDVLAVVSHDLKNPLSAIRIGSSILSRLLEKKFSIDSFRRQIALIGNAAHRMERLITDLLDFSKIEEGQLRMEQMKITVEQILHEAGLLFESVISEKQVKLKFDISPQTSGTFIRCDKERMLQVFSNIIGNAIKFSPEQGQIFIRADKRRDVVTFSVRDEGPGIPPEHLPHLFNRYWQAPSTARLGTGLGLAIVHGIITAHGGRIWVESKLGKGTTFFFELRPE
jgi:signal transduction histidine kinase